MARTYTNPVYPEYFADPFVWKYHGEYYAVGTGAVEACGEVDEARQARVFPLLHSRDFVDWRAAGGALLRPDAALGDSFWAPEVAECDDRFYLYYSVGFGDKHHQLRVATSDSPLGPYHDSREALIDSATRPFAIDPHPFRDEDGQWYLFYARDFLDAEGSVRAGTALVVDRLETMTALAGEERVVLRARYDWQRFLKDRPMYGGVYDWHTLEGPCVRKHGGRYYCFYSGGRWDNESYGVDYGVADSVLGPYSNEGSEAGARVLRTAPDHAIGPGHNSIVVGPDERTEYCAYHAWDANLNARRMFLDKLLWTPDGPRCAGPTWTPQFVEL
jgi:beta-xylosidase